MCTPESGRHILRSWDVLLVVGLLLWLTSQALPAYSNVPVGAFVTVASGLFGVLGVLLSAEWGLAAIVGWTANLWLLAALLARLSNHHAGARRCAGISVPCALAEIAAIVLGSESTYLNPDYRSGGPVYLRTAPDLADVGLGAWLWLASIVLLAISTIRWGAVRRSVSAHAAPSRPSLDEAMAKVMPGTRGARFRAQPPEG
jgi:hypothetical protein